MKKSCLGLALLVGLAGTVLHAEDFPAFVEADQDGDGLLSIEEAEQVFAGTLPGLSFEDLDSDGLLSKDAAEAVIPGLVFERNQHELNGKIDNSSYLKMVESVRQEQMLREQ